MQVACLGKLIVENSLTADEIWTGTAERLRDVANKVLGTCRDKMKIEKDKAWFWNEEIGKATKLKKQLFKEHQLAKTRRAKEEAEKNYKMAKSNCKKEVAKAKKVTFSRLYERLESGGDAGLVYKLAKQRDKASKDYSSVTLLKKEDGTILAKTDEIMERWRRHFEKISNRLPSHRES